jgi:hypothetical protein
MRLIPRHSYPYLPGDEDPALEALRRLDPGADQMAPRDPPRARSLAEAFEAPTSRRQSDPVAAFFGTATRPSPSYAAALPLPFDEEPYSYGAQRPPYDARYGSDLNSAREAQVGFEPSGPERR